MVGQDGTRNAQNPGSTGSNGSSSNLAPAKPQLSRRTIDFWVCRGLFDIGDAVSLVSLNYLPEEPSSQWFASLPIENLVCQLEVPLLWGPAFSLGSFTAGSQVSPRVHGGRF